MKIAQADIVIVPGYTGADDDHWQSRWQAKMATARRVHQDDWHKPVVEDWTANVAAALKDAQGPVVLVAHSLGCHCAVQALNQRVAGFERVAGAFLVSPPDVENPAARPKHLLTFGPYPRDPLPCPSIVIASQDDPFCSFEVAGDMANAWGSLLVDARESGHINSKSGHGPWPDGLMVFANFMKNLKA